MELVALCKPTTGWHHILQTGPLKNAYSISGLGLNLDTTVYLRNTTMSHKILIWASSPVCWFSLFSVHTSYKLFPFNLKRNKTKTWLLVQTPCLTADVCYLLVYVIHFFFFSLVRHFWGFFLFLVVCLWVLASLLVWATVCALMKKEVNLFGS